MLETCPAWLIGHATRKGELFGTPLHFSLLNDDDEDDNGNAATSTNSANCAFLGNLVLRIQHYQEANGNERSASANHLLQHLSQVKLSWEN